MKNKRFLFVSAALLLSFLLPDFASAVPMTQAGLRLGRLGNSASTGNDLLVTFKLGTVTGVNAIKITFPAGFTIATNASITVNNSTFPNTPASITGAPGATSGSSVAASRTITVPVTSPTSGTLYGFTVPTGIITNPATLGQYSPTVESTATGTTVESTTTPVYITGASADKDQIAVTASVSPSFSFSLSTNADTVPAADTSTIQTSTGVDMSVATNSQLGYTAYVKSAGAKLHSTSANGDIITGSFNASPDTFTPGTTNYGLVPSTGTAATTSTGSLTYDPEYVISDGTHAGAFNSTNFSSFVSRNGFTTGDTVNLKERVAVSSSIPYANDYADTLTVVAAGNF